MNFSDCWHEHPDGASVICEIRLVPLEQWAVLERSMSGTKNSPGEKWLHSIVHSLFVLSVSQLWHGLNGFVSRIVGMFELVRIEWDTPSLCDLEDARHFTMFCTMLLYWFIFRLGTLFLQSCFFKLVSSPMCLPQCVLCWSEFRGSNIFKRQVAELLLS